MFFLVQNFLQLFLSASILSLILLQQSLQFYFASAYLASAFVLAITYLGLLYNLAFTLFFKSLIKGISITVKLKMNRPMYKVIKIHAN